MKAEELGDRPATGLYSTPVSRSKLFHFFSPNSTRTVYTLEIPVHRRPQLLAYSALDLPSPGRSYLAPASSLFMNIYGHNPYFYLLFYHPAFETQKILSDVKNNMYV